MIIYKYPKSKVGWLIAFLCIFALLLLYHFNIDIHYYISGSIVIVIILSIIYQMTYVEVRKTTDRYVFRCRRGLKGLSVVHIMISELKEIKVDGGGSASNGIVAILKNGKVIDLNISSSFGDDMISIVK